MAVIERTPLGVSPFQHTGAGVDYVVQANNGCYYWIYVIVNSHDLFYVKSLDGQTWSTPVTLHSSITTQAVGVWYDRWSNVAADRIHIAYVEASGSDIIYNYIDTATDTIGSPVTVFNGASAINNAGCVTITKGRDGRLAIIGNIDTGTEDGCWSSTDNGATWADTIADPTEGDNDMYVLVPGWNADTADVMAIFWDVSANELSVKRYDDSADSWGETSLATSMTDLARATAFSCLAVACDLANSRNVVLAWENVDTASAKLRCWTVTDSSITEVTNVVSSSTDDQGLCALAINTSTGHWYAFYCGKTDGSETWNTSLNVYYKVSTDSGSTWGSETAVTTLAQNVRGLWTMPRFTGNFILCRSVVINSIEFLVTFCTEQAASGGGGSGGVGLIGRGRGLVGYGSPS